MAQNLIMQWTKDGELVFLSKKKGSNPNHEKHPTINCPNCGKFMYYVYDKNVKNDILCYDLADPAYQCLPRSHIRICPKCHHRIGIMHLNPRLRKKLALPLRHECHEKITIK